MCPGARWGQDPAVPCKGCILVAEDDRDLREALVACLEDLGCTVLAASDGADALAQLERTRLEPCLILSDLMMPRLDGASLAVLARECPRHCAVPFVSMSAGGAALLPPLVDSHLQKPFRLEALMPLLERFCRDPAWPRRRR
jgi:CheY-like chemotaxis protein